MTRGVIRDKLEARLGGSSLVLAMWEAGSTAFSRTDRYSDLDIGVLYATGNHDQIWKIVDDAFEELGGVEYRWIEPNRIFKGGLKRIFRLKQTGEWLRVDIHLFPDTARDLQNQPERHGQIAVLFDHTGRLRAPTWNKEINRQLICQALHQTLMKWQLHYGWFRKELARGREVDAFMVHLHATVIPLLTVMNMRFRPNRWDFGFRYFKEELPAAAVEVVERLCYVPNAASLEERFAEADRFFQISLLELRKQGIAPIDPNGLDISPWCRVRTRPNPK